MTRDERKVLVPAGVALVVGTVAAIKFKPFGADEELRREMRAGAIYGAAAGAVAYLIWGRR